MPRAPRRCPGCETNLVHPPAKYCETCTPKKNWQGSRRGKATAGAPWRRLRAEILERDDYRCYLCGQDGVDVVDHLVPVAEGGTDDPGNLGAICRRCHGKKTAAEGGRAPRAPRSTDIDMSSSRALRDLPGY